MLNCRSFFIVGAALMLLGTQSHAISKVPGCEQSLGNGPDREPSRDSSPALSNQVTALHARWRESIYQNYPEVLVRAAYMTLENLMKRHPIAFYEYVMLCRDADHKLFGNSGKYLVENTSQLVSLRDGRYREDRSMRELTLALTNDKELTELGLLPPPARP